MKKILQAMAGVLVLLLAGVVVLRITPIHVYDGFEDSRLSWRRWSSWRYVRGAVAMERGNVRAGSGALAITVHSGDRHEAASDEGAATERDELMEPWWLFSRTGRSYVYSFSLYLPKEIPQTSERLVIAQWRQLCEARRCRPDYPVLAIRLKDARLAITRRDEHGSGVLYEGREDARGRWLDFRFVTQFDPAHGSVDATLDGKSIVHYRGPTVYQPGPGYPARGLVYFKTGLYRDALGEPPWTMYVDEYRKDECGASGCS